ncbi:tetratricopeptide (TPR) repeat protein [Thermocatellispora tengchongensis]|uniref:Tetratricopeptide (TPR) repeat protein n=1 Tax=Thermocatellispora tengchongensis TaxID=1073253 RepID=A0A840P794_9ACTN|nr:CHAT domain-containing protein [Thermocatellispora tengchongensis]MBB5134456.1 tetratricopeptide (TPR) repeat protein [Thermocatellispora tengchongensis]
MTADREAIQEEARRLGIDASLAAIVLRPHVSEGYSLYNDVVLLPVDFLSAFVAAGGLSPETLAAGLRRSVELLRPHGDTLLLGTSLLSLAQALRLRASVEERWQILAEAVEVFTRLGNARQAGRCLLEVGTTLRDHGLDYDALTAYDRAEELLSRAQDVSGLRVIRHQRAVAFRAAGQYEEALLELDRMAGLRLEDEANPAVKDAWLSERIACLIETGDLTGAAAHLEDYRAGADEDAAGFNLAIGHYLRGRLMLARREEEAAMDALLAAAVSAARTVRRHATLSFRVSDRRQLDVTFTAALAQAMRLRRGDLVPGILALAKSVRPGALLPHGGQSAGDEGDAPDDRDGRDERDDRDGRMASSLRALAVEATKAAVSHRHDRLDAISRQAAALTDARQILTPGVPAGGVRPAAELASLPAGRLPAGVMAAEVFRAADDRLWIAALSAGESVLLPTAITYREAALLALGVHRELEARQPCRALDRLGAELLAPLADRLPALRRLYLVLPEPLASVPVHAAATDGVPLLARLDVGYLPSLEYLATGTAGSPAAAPVALAVSDPVYETMDVLDALPAEVAAIADAFPGTEVYAEERATTEVLKTAMRAPILHIGGHAAFEGARPLLARVLLADRPAFAFEIAALRSQATVVNLSGCRTAAALRHPGGESEGLAAAFLSAGAKTVVATWWPIQDEAGAAFNRAFYAALATGLPVEDAVAGAQRSLLGTARFGHPADWAAFVTLGAALEESP